MNKNLTIATLLTGVLFTTNAYSGSISEKDYSTMNLSQLIDIPIYSVSKRDESAFQASSAISTLTSDDIRRSGATSIPEVLRLVPGIEVAQISSNKWAVTARGFNSQFSNKLLVLIDGISVYNSLFSGVFWDTRGVPLEDIDRIEVIKGPGSTMWGANAVNGVINIITKSALYDQGEEIIITKGNEEGRIYARHGGQIGKKDYKNMNPEDVVRAKIREKEISKKYYKFYAERQDNDESKLADGTSSNDDWAMNRAGFRFDINRREQNNNLKEDIIIKSDFHSGNIEQESYLPLLSNSPTYTLMEDSDESVAGGNILIKWDKETSSQGDGFFAQIYYDGVKRKNIVLEQRRNTLDFEFQKNTYLNKRNFLSWGVNYRYIEDNLEETQVNGITYLDYNPSSEENDIISAFVQDKITLIENKLFFTIGSKFSHNDYTHFETQPSAKVSYLPSPNQTFWASISKSVRTPTRGEHGLTLIGQAYPLASGYIAQIGSEEFDSEEGYSTEFGYRNRSIEDLTVDTSIFHTRYDKLASWETGSAYLDGNGLIIIPLNLKNDASADVYGGEISINYDITDDWRMLIGYNYLQVETDLDANYSDTTVSSLEGDTPENQVTIRSQYNITPNVELDNTLHFVDELASFGIKEYYRFDTRVAYYPTENLELSIVGKNLFDNQHQEYTASIYSVPTEIERSMYFKLGYKF